MTSDNRDATPTSTSQNVTIARTFAEQIVEMLKHHTHIFEPEQQTGHPVCAWCGDCDDPKCSHYWRGRP